MSMSNSKFIAQKMGGIFNLCMVIYLGLSRRDCEIYDLRN